MIKVDFYWDQGHIKGFVAQGHALAAPRGEDLVCAAVSALTQTALLGLEAFLSKKPLWQIKPEGYLACWLPDDLATAELEKAELIIKTLKLGIEAIAENHSRHLQVRKRRWTPCCLK